MSGHEKEIKMTQNKGNQMVQFLAGIGACNLMVACGSYQAWSSPSLPHLTSKESPFPVTDDQGTWIVTLFLIGDFLGSLFNPLLIDRIGRKYTLLISALLLLIGWLLIVLAENYIWLYLARFIGGVGQGSIFNSLVIYLAEISEKHIRGTLINIMRVGKYVGIFISSSIAAYLPYSILNLSSVILTVIVVVIVFLLPETPYYYLMKGEDEKAIKYLMFLRGLSSPESLHLEIKNMKLTIVEDQKNNGSGFRELFVKNYNRKGLMILTCLKVTQLLTGYGAIIYYAQEILSLSGSSIEAGVGVMIVTGIQLLASLAAIVVIDRIDRRKLLLSSGIVDAVSLTIVGLFFFLQTYNPEYATYITWLPLFGLVLYQVAFALGIGIIPYVLLGELFSINVKGAAVASALVIGSIFNFATSAGFKILNNSIGIYATFWLFAIIAIVGSVVTFCITPETRGMTLEEIQAMQNPRMKVTLEKVGKVNLLA